VAVRVPPMTPEELSARVDAAAEAQARMDRHWDTYKRSVKSWMAKEDQQNASQPSSSPLAVNTERS
jgi:hypothetical protein